MSIQVFFNDVIDIVSFQAWEHFTFDLVGKIYAFSDLSFTRSRLLGLGHRRKTALKVMLGMSYFVWRSTYH